MRTVLALNDVASSTRELFTNSPDIGRIADIQNALQAQQAARAAAVDAQRDVLRSESLGMLLSL